MSESNDAQMMTQLIEVVGKIELLRNEVSGSHSLTLSKIEAFERENKQRFLFYDELIKIIRTKQEEHDKRFEDLATAIKSEVTTVNQALKSEVHSISQDFDRIDQRIKVQELNWAKVVGFIVGTGVVSSGTTVGLLKLLGV